ncbi:MAG: DUF1211 domain-containing protein [Bacteroidetes bacterium]|nr:DUF1211 domain-containing protein [Bacteroidota bacterium]
MLRESVMKSALTHETGFRWRGGEISRIEGFSDNVFGFALTLLVVSLEVPRTFIDLQSTLRGFIGFTFAFALFFLFWYEHYKFFRRYGLNDSVMLWLNAVFLFVILFFVYPLKFLISVLSRIFSGQSLTVTGSDGVPIPMIDPQQMVTLMVIYGIGSFLIFGLLTVMYRYAWSQRDALGLSETERIITRGSIRSHTASLLIALLSIAIAVIGGPSYTGWAGYTYCLIGPVQAVLGYRNGKAMTAALGSSADA